MDLFEAIKDRRSIRKFKDEPVKNEDLNKIIESGIWAPSAGNLQSWELIVVRDPQIISRLASAAYLRDFVGKAPLILVLCSNPGISGAIYNDRGRELYSIQDATCAGQNMLLAAHGLGLGSCWVGSFDEALVKEILGIPNDIRPIALLTMGYSDENPFPPPRDDVDSFVHEERY